MRHAEAVRAQPGQTDVQRPLTPAGRARAAAQAGVVLAHAPQAVLCSAALRTRETLAQLALDEGAVDVRVEDELYHAHADDLLLRLALFDDHVRSALVVGHMPTLANAVGALTGNASSGFAPGDIAVLTLDRPWSALTPGCATLSRPPG